jgi:hypothetical protein
VPQERFPFHGLSQRALGKQQPSGDRALCRTPRCGPGKPGWTTSAGGDAHDMSGASGERHALLGRRPARRVATIMGNTVCGCGRR